MLETINKPSLRFLVLGVLLGMVLHLGTTFAASAVEKPFDPNALYDTKLSLQNLITTYHDQMNKEFNKTTKQLVTLLSQNKDLGNAEKQKAVLARISAPEEGKEDTCYDEGPSMNLSTFCLALRTDQFYEAYTGALETKRSTLLQDSAGNPIPSDAKQADVEAIVAVRNNMIDDEFHDAKRTLDAALTAYQELQTAFPMHMQLEQTKDLLIRYRDRLVEIRKKVDEFPSRFINATTTNCK